MTPTVPVVPADELFPISDWFSSRLGKQIIETETAILDPLLSSVFGYHLLQIGITERELFGASPVGHKFRMGVSSAQYAPVIGRVNELPFEKDSLDVVVLHHLLDFYESPHPILREVARVVIPSGYLVIVGFNPWSIWGLWKMIPFIRKNPPWNGATILPGRLMDWLTLLDFKIDRAIYGFYRLPLPVKSRFRLPDYSQGLSRKLNWPFGAIYVIVARKQVSTLTPIQPRWRKHSLREVTAAQPLNKISISGEKIVD
ncbi:MAG: methyltransferase domain-containing protein [Gammaproteobacteria bacterium]|nr:methyltransferase domain-containing protein [Gammaproteobacteria bacterium]